MSPTIGVVAQYLVKIQDNATAIIVDEEDLIGHLNNFMIEEALIETDFTTVDILDNEAGYFLIAQGEAYRTAFALAASDTGEGIFRATGLSCTTTCGPIPDVCMPNTTNNTCAPVCETGTCTRTISVGTNILTYL